MPDSRRTMTGAKVRKVIGKKTISKIGARLKGLAGTSKQRAALALRLKQKKAALKEKERQKKEQAKARKDFAAAKKREETLLSPEAIREKRKLESMIGSNMDEVIKKIVKDDAVEVAKLAQQQAGPADSSQELSVEQLSNLNKAVDAALEIYRNMWIEYIFEYDRDNIDGDDRQDRADAYMEIVVAERYEQVREAMTALLPFLPPMTSAGGDQDYVVFEVDGKPYPKHLEKGASNWLLLAAQYPATGLPALEKVMGASIACWRREASFRALEAFSALMAVISARKEKSFLEVFETRKDLERAMKKLQKKGLKVAAKDTPSRKAEIRRWLPTQYYQGYGYFAHYLTKPHAKMRVAFKSSVPAPIPVSLIATERVTLFDALGSPDTGDGCFVGVAKSFDWCSQQGTEFAFQEAIFGVEEKAKNGKKLRVASEDLVPSSELRTLILSRKPIVYLEVTAALAPKDIMRSQGLSAIVIAELAQLMSDAKSRGEAVCMAMGSCKPHKLAEKVYLRKPIGDHGLRCGYFRWRRSAATAWANEVAWSDRSCYCFQMP